MDVCRPVALLILGAAGGVLWSERHGGMRARPAAPNRDAQTPAASPDGRSMPGMSGMSASSGQAGAARAEEAVEVSLTPEAVERAGIKIAEAKAQSSVSGLTVPGTVTSNAYRDTKVNALVGGIVRQVMVELGAEVRRGAPLAVIFSSELAEFPLFCDRVLTLYGGRQTAELPGKAADESSLLRAMHGLVDEAEAVA